MPLTFMLLTIASTLWYILLALTFFDPTASSAWNTWAFINWLIRANLIRHLEIALDFETGRIAFRKSLLQLCDFALQSLDMLKEFVLLGHIIAQLVVDRPLLFVEQVRVFLIQEYASLLGWQVRCGCLSHLFACLNFTAISHHTCLAHRYRHNLLLCSLFLLEYFKLILLIVQFVLELSRLTIHHLDFRIQRIDDVL